VIKWLAKALRLTGLIAGQCLLMPIPQASVGMKGSDATTLMISELSYVNADAVDYECCRDYSSLKSSLGI